MEPHRPDETEEETSEGGNHQSLITSAVVIGIVHDEDIAGLPHSIACGSVRARPSLSEQWTSMSDDCMASGIWLGGKSPVNLILSTSPNSRTCCL